MVNHIMTKSTSKELLSILYGQKGISDSYVNFQIALAEITEKYKNLDRPPEIVFPAEDTLRSKFAEGIPLINFVPVSFPLKDLSANFREIVSAFLSHGICTEEVSKWLEKPLDIRFLKDITDAAVSFDFDALRVLSEPTPFDEPTLILISRELVKPFFQILAGRTTELVSFAHWLEGYCPICGEAPVFARLSKEEEGKRYLWCARCDVEWGFQRLCCPYCKNSDHKKLKFLTADFREELRVDVCEKCKGYIKTIDERKAAEEAETVFLKENVASVYLDIVAEEKGYTKQLPSFQDALITFPGDQEIINNKF